MDTKGELQSAGLKPMDWADSLEAIEKKLEPEAWQRFSSLLRNFTSYASEESHAQFYDFVYAHRIQLEINAHRFMRLAAILDELLAQIKSGASILDIGAGTGLIAKVLAKLRAPKRYMVQDPCRGAREYLAHTGLAVLPYPTSLVPLGGPFDILLCVDSLGELHSDEDDALSDPAYELGENLPFLIEERYGFAQKLNPWKPYLAKKGRVLLWEPFTHPPIWGGLSSLLASHGWKNTFRKGAGNLGYLELTLAEA